MIPKTGMTLDMYRWQAGLKTHSAPIVGVFMPLEPSTNVRFGGAEPASSMISMHLGGHACAQAPQPMQLSWSKRGRPRKAFCGSNGSAGNFVV